MLIHGSGPDPTIMFIVLPLAILLDVGASLYFLQDLYQPSRRVRGDDKQFWAVVIVLGSVLGWAAYVLYGREA